jgi:nucleotide-binding universal stress UspA family protein
MKRPASMDDGSAAGTQNRFHGAAAVPDGHGTGFMRPRSALFRPPDGVRPDRRTERRPVFTSAVCAAGRSPTGHVARHQAAALVDPDGTVQSISAYAAARHGHGALLDRCDGADLLVLAAGGDSHTVLKHASIPVLLARPTQLGTEVTDRIIVASDVSPESRRAAEVAGLLAAGRGAVVAIMPAPEPDPAVQRAVAASGRIVLASTGMASPVLGDQPPLERAIPVAAAALDASLLVLPLSTESARSRAALIARRIGCSVLAVPASRPGGPGWVGA